MWVGGVWCVGLVCRRGLALVPSVCCACSGWCVVSRVAVVSLLALSPSPRSLARALLTVMTHSWCCAPSLSPMCALPRRAAPRQSLRGRGCICSLDWVGGGGGGGGHAGPVRGSGLLVVRCTFLLWPARLVRVVFLKKIFRRRWKVSWAVWVLNRKGGGGGGLIWAPAKWGYNLGHQ